MRRRTIPSFVRKPSQNGNRPEMDKADPNKVVFVQAAEGFRGTSRDLRTRSKHQ